jgi:hypothetical protein
MQRNWRQVCVDRRAIVLIILSNRMRGAGMNAKQEIPARVRTEDTLLGGWREADLGQRFSAVGVPIQATSLNQTRGMRHGSNYYVHGLQGR